MSIQTIGTASRSRWAKARSFLVREFRELLPPTIFFFVGFNLILLTKRLLLAEALMQSAGFLLATTSALIVGKAVLVANLMPFLRRFDHAPLIQPILFKTVVYSLVVLAARLLEALIHYLVENGALGGGGFIRDLLGQFDWGHFIVTQLWIFVLFLIYVSASELDNLLGDGELYKLLFTRRSSELKSTRRARIHLLTRLSRLTEIHSVETLCDPKSPSHAELVTILRRLAGAERVR